MDAGTTRAISRLNLCLFGRRAAAVRNPDQSAAGGKLRHHQAALLIGQTGPDGDFIARAGTAHAKAAGRIELANLDTGT